MDILDEKACQNKNESSVLPKLKKVHHRYYATYEGVPDIEYVYKGEKIIGVVSGLTDYDFHIQLKDYPNYLLHANKGYDDTKLFEKVVFINDSCTGLSEAGLERAIECMKKIYDMYHDPKTGAFRDYRETLFEIAGRFRQEFDDAHADEYAELFLRESKRVWQSHVRNRLEQEAKKVRGEKVKDAFGGDEALREIDKICHELGERRRSYVLNAFEKFALESIQIDNPYDYVKVDEICSSYLSAHHCPEVVERYMQSYVQCLETMKYRYTIKINVEYEQQIDSLHHDKISYKHELKLKKIDNREYMKKLAQLRSRRAKIEEKKVEKVRELLLNYAKTALNIEGNYVEGYIYYLTPYPILSNILFGNEKVTHKQNNSVLGNS